MTRVSLVFVLNLSFGLSVSADCIKSVGQMFMVRVPPPANKIVGGVILFGDNFKKMSTPNDVLQLTMNLQKLRNPPLFIAVDQEGGLVQRLNEMRGFTKIPSHFELGETNSVVKAFEFGRVSSAELSAVGINWNFGTVLDVNSNPKNPVIGKYKRSFGTTPERVTKIGGALLAGQSNGSVIQTLKHFPGHGDTNTDSHVGLASVNKLKKSMEEIELKPFRDVLARSEIAPAVMVGHISLPKILGKDGPPASLSREVVTGWLREDIGHQGLIVTDDLLMGAVKKRYGDYDAIKSAIKAGNDVLILGKISTQEQHNVAKKICKEAEGDSLLAGEIKESSKRILNTKKEYGLKAPTLVGSIGGRISTAKHNDYAKTILELANVDFKQKTNYPFPKVKPKRDKAAQ